MNDIGALGDLNEMCLDELGLLHSLQRLDPAGLDQPGERKRLSRRRQEALLDHDRQPLGRLPVVEVEARRCAIRDPVHERVDPSVGRRSSNDVPFRRSVIGGCIERRLVLGVRSVDPLRGRIRERNTDLARVFGIRPEHRVLLDRRRQLHEDRPAMRCGRCQGRRNRLGPNETSESTGFEPSANQRSTRPAWCVPEHRGRPAARVTDFVGDTRERLVPRKVDGWDVSEDVDAPQGRCRGDSLLRQPRQLGRRHRKHVRQPRQRGCVLGLEPPVRCAPIKLTNSITQRARLGGVRSVRLLEHRPRKRIGRRRTTQFSRRELDQPTRRRSTHTHEIPQRRSCINACIDAISMHRLPCAEPGRYNHQPEGR